LRRAAALSAIVLSLLILASPVPAGAHEIPFAKTTEAQIVNGKVEERDVKLVFDDDKLTVRTRDDKQVYHDISYSKISKFSYEEAAQPRAAAEAGAKVSSDQKRHWLTIHYTENGKPAVVLLALDESEFGQALAIAGMVTQKDVEGAP